MLNQQPNRTSKLISDCFEDRGPLVLMCLGPLSTKTAKKSDPIKKNDTSRLFFGRSGAISVKN